MGFNNLWIQFIFREFNCVSISKIPSPIIQMEIWPRYLGGRIFWFTIIFLPLSSRYGFFAIPSLVLSYLELSGIVTKVNFKYFNGNFAEAWLFEKFIFELDASSYSFKITYILSRQVISLKGMVVSSAKFTILILWSPICIPLIFFIGINESGNYLSRNNV